VGRRTGRQLGAILFENRHRGRLSVLGSDGRESYLPSVPDYRLAPEHLIPAAIRDLEACYRGLVDKGITKIALTGDSAGGNWHWYFYQLRQHEPSAVALHRLVLSRSRR
jgi:hypothetical protein